MSHRSAFPKSLHQRPRATSSSSPFFSHLSVASRPHIKRPPIFPPPLRLEFTGNNLLRYFQPLLYSQSSQYFPVPPTFSVPSIFPTFSSILNTDTIIWYPVFVALISPLSSFGVHSLSTGPILSVLPTLPLLLSHPLSIVVYECPIFECSSDIPFLSFCLGLLFSLFFFYLFLTQIAFFSFVIIPSSCTHPLQHHLHPFQQIHMFLEYLAPLKHISPATQILPSSFSLSPFVLDITSQISS